MGTTLSNGVYLPDEGERNCYAGLKVNWEILNQKVADIVALQSAIAGALHREWANVYLSKINNLEPSSLSLPSTQYVDISGSITDMSGIKNTYVAPSNGFIVISATGTGINMYVNLGMGTVVNRQTSGGMRCFIPILKSQTVNIIIWASNLEFARFFPCQGNV